MLLTEAGTEKTLKKQEGLLLCFIGSLEEPETRHVAKRLPAKEVGTCQGLGNSASWRDGWLDFPCSRNQRIRRDLGRGTLRQAVELEQGCIRYIDQRIPWGGGEEEKRILK